MKMERKFRTIDGTQIILFWSDKTEGEICWHEMPDGLRQDWDDWLSTIERERNLGAG